MPTHTPGPWTAQKDIRHSANIGIITNGPLWWAIYSPTTRIARMEEPAPWLPEAEQQANALLFAASPALLQACKNAVVDLEWRTKYKHGNLPPQKQYENPAITILRELTAAIKAAEPDWE